MPPLSLSFISQGVSMRTNFQSAYPQMDMGSSNYFSFNMAALASMTNQQLEVSNELHMPLCCLPLLPPRHGAPHSSDPTANCDNSLVAGVPTLPRSSTQQSIIFHVWGSSYLYMVAHLNEGEDKTSERQLVFFNKDVK